MWQKPRTRVFTVLVAILLVSSIGAATAKASPPYKVAVTPAKPIAGSSVNVLTFQFSAVNAARGWNTVQVPAVASGSAWSAPQSSNPADPGFVAVSKQTCNSASLSSITGSAGGPWTILVNATCARNASFAIRYGAGPSPVTVPTKAGPYVFTTTRVVEQPVVNVIAGPSATVDVSGLADAVAGTPQNPIVTVTDAYGNTATRYRGTVHFTGSGDPPAFSFGDSGWEVPDDYTFTAGDAGAHTFAAIAKTAGEQTLEVGASKPNGAMGAFQTITISPGPTAYQTANFSTITGSAIPGQTIRANIEAVAVDGHGNVATGDNAFINVKVNDGSSEYLLGASLENGRHTFNISVAAVGSQVQVSAFAQERPGVTPLGSIFVLYGPPPRLDEVKLDWDPTTQNPDGTYNGHLDIKDPDTSVVQQTDPNSIVVSGDPIVSANGTTSIPITIDLTSGGTISTTITVTTPTDPTTGQFVNANYSTGQELQVLGCDSANETFASIDAGTVPTGLPPAPPCPNATWDPVTVNQNTAYVWDPLAETYLSPIVGVYVAP